MSGENPCNICHADCKEEECIFYLRYNRAYVCEAYDCFVNCEGSCLLSLYDDCGCRKYHEVRKV